MTEYADTSPSSQAGEETTYPSGTYMITAAGPYGGSWNASVPTSVFATNVPYFTGDMVGLTTGFNPAVSHSLTWNSFTNSDNQSTLATTFSIFDVAANTTVFTKTQSGATYHGDVIAPGLLQGSREYLLEISFSTQYALLAPATNNVSAALTGMVQFNQTTSFDFTTSAAVPEPFTLGLMALGGYAFFRRKHRS